MPLNLAPGPNLIDPDKAFALTITVLAVAVCMIATIERLALKNASRPSSLQWADISVTPTLTPQRRSWARKWRKTEAPIHTATGTELNGSMELTERNNSESPPVDLTKLGSIGDMPPREHDIYAAADILQPSMISPLQNNPGMASDVIAGLLQEMDLRLAAVEQITWKAPNKLPRQ